MKKLTLSLIMAAATLAASAQTRTEKIGLGVHGGLSLFKMSNVDNSSYKTGFMAGVTATFPVAQNLYLQPELNFQQQGVKGKYLENGTDFSGKLRANYVNLPVLVKYKFAPTHLSVFAGPQIGYLTGASQKVDASDWSSIRDNMRKVDFAGVYGAEYYFPVSKVSSIVIDARYQTSFTNAIKKDFSDSKSKYNGFVFSVGYRF